MRTICKGASWLLNSSYHERYYVVSHHQIIQKLSVYAILMICTLFNSRKGQVVTEMTANGLENNRRHSVLSPSQQHALSSAIVMEVNGTPESMLSVNLFFAKSAIFALVCYIFRNTAHLG